MPYERQLEGQVAGSVRLVDSECPAALGAAVFGATDTALNAAGDWARGDPPCRRSARFRVGLAALVGGLGRAVGLSGGEGKTVGGGVAAAGRAAGGTVGCCGATGGGLAACGPPSTNDWPHLGQLTFDPAGSPGDFIVPWQCGQAIFGSGLAVDMRA